MESAGLFIGLALAGFVIGAFSGLLGIGGGTIMVPTLRLVFGLSAYASTGTSLFTMIFTSISGSISHFQQKTNIPLLGLVLGLGGAVTSALGVYMNSLSPSWLIMLATAVIICYSAYSMVSKALKLPKGGAKAAPEKAEDAEGDDAEAPAPVAAKAVSPEPLEYHLTPKRVLGGLGIGLLAGFFAGYVGVGGGFVMVPLMTAFLGVPMRLASGTSLLAIIILAIPGVIEQVMYGNVDFIAGIALAVGSIPGAAVGARFVKWIPERQLRLIFAGFLVVAAVALVVNEFAL